jgi:hypothetical protein
VIQGFRTGHARAITTGGRTLGTAIAW